MTFVERLAALCFALLAGLPAAAQQVDFEIADTLDLRGEEIGYQLSLDLAAVAPTRVKVDALLDLREFQSLLAGSIENEVLIDLCRSEAIVESVSISATDLGVQLSGDVMARFFECSGGLRGERERVAELETIDLAFSATADIQVLENCFAFQLEDLSLRRVSESGEVATRSDAVEATKTLALEAIGVILRNTPFCPQLPPELASLDPIYQSGGVREIEDGGVGVALIGTLDVSTETILDILRVLQSRK